MQFKPDHAGLAAIRVEAEDSTVPRLTDAIFADSQRFVPILSGDLRASGTTEYADGVGLVSYGDEDVDYPVYQEIGTSKMAAQPYLRPAAYMAREL